MASNRTSSFQQSETNSIAAEFVGEEGTQRIPRNASDSEQVGLSAGCTKRSGHSYFTRGEDWN